ncbi:MAG: hypothetical protein H7145_07360 [Akkermansiaceae bacterium]|nr:hypothetical protein [Armatimonadota bacterium]
MAFYSLLTAVRPHRVAGGIGLLLISAGIASVRYPFARPTSFNAAGMTSAITGPQNLLQRPSQEGNNNNESDVAYRGFSLSTEALPPFHITNLSLSMREGEQFDILALSQQGAVLGTVIPLRDNSVSPGTKRAAPRTYAARWENGTLYRLPIPPGAHRVVAGDINDRGDIGAVSIRYRRGKPSFNRVILYPRDNPFQDLGTLDTEYAQSETDNSSKMRGVSENLLCLNNRGTLMALVGSKSWFRRSDGAMAPVGDGIAFDLNNNDTAVGFVGAFASGAVMWRNATFPDKSSMTQLLPSHKSLEQGGQSYWRGSAECINDKGNVVVSVPIDSSNGFRRLGRTAYYLLRDGKLQLIAQMRGYQRARSHINDYGDVIGFADTDQQTQKTSPILYRDGRMYDLTDVAQKSGWTIVGAADINNRRQILAYGVHTSQADVTVPILLTPMR